LASLHEAQEESAEVQTQLDRINEHLEELLADVDLTK